MKLLAEIEGKAVPLEECFYVLWSACGCPRAVTVAGRTGVITEDDASEHLLPTKRERDRAERDGMHIGLITRDQWVSGVRDAFEPECPHAKDSPGDDQTGRT